MRRVTLQLGVVFILAVGGCGSGQGGGDQKINQQVAMKYLLLSQLKDPDSAKFDQVKAYVVKENGGQLTYNFCGTVNAKNGLGGYTGPQRFSGTAAMVALEDSTSDFGAIWSADCTDANGGEDVWL